MAAETGGITRIIGIGSHHGVDRLGWIICDQLRDIQWPQDIDIQTCRTPAQLPALLRGCDNAIVLDAIVTGHNAGQVMSLSITELEHQTQNCYSSHGFGVIEAIELAQALEQLPAVLQILGISVTDADQDAVVISTTALPHVQQAILEFQRSLQH